MVAEIPYITVFTFITVLWVIVRAIVALKNRKIDIRHELKLLIFYFYIEIMAMIVYFPMNFASGQIGTMKFDSERIIPPLLNPVPIIHIFDRYAGWLRNLIGNIILFIPIGIIWPFCFKKMNNILKVTAAGLGFSLFIELSQLLLYERMTDADDLILNTLGALTGAVIYFSVSLIIRKKRKSKQMERRINDFTDKENYSASVD